MRHRFKDSRNENILNQKLYRKINSIRTLSSRKVEFLSKIMSFLPLTFEHANYLFHFYEFYASFMTLKRIGFNFFAKIMKGSLRFCCPSCISFNPTSQSPGGVLEKGTFRSFAKFTEKHECQVLRIPFLTEHLRWLLLFLNFSKLTLSSLVAFDLESFISCEGNDIFDDLCKNHFKTQKLCLH